MGARADFQRMQMRILFAYIAIVFLMVAGLSTIILSVTDRIMSNKISALIAATSQQIEMNINNYMEKVEKTAILLYADDEYYQYDPTNSGLDEYETIQREDDIYVRLVELDLTENFCDFVICYSNGSNLGMLSKATSDLYKNDSMYDNMSQHLTDTLHESGWAFGVGGLQDRMYYLKRLNPDAIMVVSFYSRELSGAFRRPDQLDDMEINLINDEDIILYSSNVEDIGMPLEKYVSDILYSKSDNLSSEYIVNLNTCENGWRVVCSVSKDTIFKELKRVRRDVLLGSVLFGMLFCAGGLFLITRLTKPFDKSVANLENKATMDRLSGLLNKLSFQDAVGRTLSTEEFGKTHAFIMCDMDNFKSINDTLGHAYGDEVIARMGKILGENYGSKYTVGRLGGDEFAMYGFFNDTPCENVLEEVKHDIERLFEIFDVEYAEEKQKLSISLSIGICVQNDERRFQSLYSHADEALYESKHGGKNRYTIYVPHEEDEQKDGKEAEG